MRIRRAEAERDRLRLHFEQLPLACIAVDAALRITDWNLSAEKVFGYRKEDAVGENSLDLLVPLAARGQVDEVVRRLRAGDRNANSVNENQTKDGRTILCEWFNTPLTAPNAAFSGCLSLAHDISGRPRQFR